MSYHTNIVRLRSVANALGQWKDKVVFVGGATVSLYASRPLAVTIRPTDDVDVVVELLSLNEFYELQNYLLDIGFKHDTESPVISRFLLKGLKVDFMPSRSDVLGFSNKWYPKGIENSVLQNLEGSMPIRVFTSPYFIASKLEAFNSRGARDIYASHDLEDIIFVLDHRDTIAEELHAADSIVKSFLREEFSSLLATKGFEEALIGHVEQLDQTQRSKRVVQLLRSFISS